MSEPKYPRAWGVYIHWPSGLIECESSWHTEEKAGREASNWNETTTVVELIPLPEHERIVAAAVAAERERCAAISKQVEAESGGPVGETQADWLGDPSSPPYCCGACDAAEEIERRIREVPK